MADEADRAQVQEEFLLQAAIRDAARPLAPGFPGDCERCGDPSPRLVGGICAPCRDGRNRFHQRRLPDA